MSDHQPPLLQVEVDEIELIWFLQSERERGAISFKEAVYTLVSHIPVGHVLGYGQVAGFIGSPRAARQVGFALGSLDPHRADPDQADSIPWWRVLRTSGQIALRGDSERPELQAHLLRSEGVKITDYKVKMSEYAWRPQLDKVAKT